MRRAVNTVFTPFACATFNGLLTNRTPQNDVIASVRTAQVCLGDVIQQHTIDAVEDTTTDRTTCAAGKYRPAAWKSMYFSSSPKVIARSLANGASCICSVFLLMLTTPIKDTDAF